ncbi:MAG: sigma-70 family RNA polymerase sigma factor, partial [Polyangiaceae bacterium]|nr:sigma-70 family RNA polymerase sigma factor [Polyangiaceae bacterium]
MTRARPVLRAVPPAQEEPGHCDSSADDIGSSARPREPAGRSSDGVPPSLDPDKVYRRYAAYVAATAHRLLGGDHEVDDTVQEVFVIAVRGLKSVRDPEAVKGWLACIAVRVVRRRLRMRRARKFVGFDTPVPLDPADWAASPEQRTLLLQVYRALESLPANERIAWTLRYLQGERLEDVAAQCGYSLATAKRRIAAASRV